MDIDQDLGATSTVPTDHEETEFIEKQFIQSLCELGKLKKRFEDEPKTMEKLTYPELSALDGDLRKHYHSFLEALYTLSNMRKPLVLTNLKSDQFPPLYDAIQNLKQRIGERLRAMEEEATKTGGTKRSGSPVPSASTSAPTNKRQRQ